MTRRALCHPQRPYEALGFCHNCYYQERRRRKRVAREAALSAGQALLLAVQVRITDFDPIPKRVNGAVQHVFETLPDECPKCHSRVLTEILRGVECRLGCGWTGYVVRPGFASVSIGRSAPPRL